MTDHPRDTSVTHLDPSVEVYALAVESDQIEPIPAGGRKKKRLGVAAWLAIIWIVGLLVLAIIAPLLPIPGPNESFAEIARSGPVSGHILGGDANGRDLLSRIIYGTRSSFAVGFGAVIFGLVIGGLLGLITGFFRGLADTILTPLMNILLAIPAVRAGPVAGDGAGRRRRRVQHPAHRRGDPGPGHRVHPHPGPHHPGQHPDLVGAGVRAGGPGHGRQELADHVPRGPAQRVARPCCPSRCWAWASPSSPRAA